MSFDETRLSLRIGFGSAGGPAFSTEIVTIDGGYERRNQNWSQARRRFDAATGLRSASDVAALTAFFHARAGRARGFRLRDWSDYTSNANGTGAASATDQPLGAGNGTTTQFQLAKTYTSGGVTHTRTIRKPVSGTVLVAVNGTPVASGWSVNTTTGIVAFTSAPASGAILTAGYSFDVPVRFDIDQLNLSLDNFAGSHAQIPLIEIRV